MSFPVKAASFMRFVTPRVYHTTAAPARPMGGHLPFNHQKPLPSAAPLKPERVTPEPSTKQEDAVKKTEDQSKKMSENYEKFQKDAGFFGYGNGC